MRKISRRDAILGACGVGAGILGADTAASGQRNDVPASFSGNHKPKPLPFSASKLNGISEKLITSHYENNYKGAVNGLNAIEKELSRFSKEKDLPPSIYATLKREELIRTGSVVLHEMYFANLGGSGKADGPVRKMMDDWFGSYDAWEAEFKRTASGLSGGSGWVTLGFNQHTRGFHNYWSPDHTVNSPFCTPILVLDMYEHAYQMDYGAAASKYIDAFMLNINWDEVNRRIETLGKLA